MLKSIIAGLVLTVSIGASASAETVTIATEGAYEPWNFTAADGTLKGFEVDLANNLCERMKVTCNIVAQDWDGMIPALQAKKYDAIMASMIITPKRLEVIDFSTPYAPTAATFMVDGSGPLAKLPGEGTTIDLNGAPEAVAKELKPLQDALKGLTVGTQNSTAGAKFLDAYLKSTVTIREYKTTEQHDLDLQSGRLDAVLSQKSQLAVVVTKPDYKSLKLAGPTLVGGAFGSGIGVGVRKSDSALKAKFDAAIEAAKADGTINKLAEQWLKTRLF